MPTENTSNPSPRTLRSRSLLSNPFRSAGLVEINQTLELFSYFFIICLGF